MEDKNEILKCMLVAAGMKKGGGVTPEELAAALAVKADKAVIKTTMDSVAVAGTQYYLGEQSAVAVTLPDTAEVGQQISVVFYSGSTAATLSISGDILGDVPVPSANQRVEVNVLWDGTFWAIVSNTLAVPVEETV